MKKDYLVTVLIAAYNHEKYILECLESIHNQSYRDFQWIVVDDCSKDRTPQILLDNQKKYGYELILHEKNIGLSATLTETIRDYVKGEFLVMCASDDAYLPNKIEVQLKYLQENPQYVMCYSRVLLMDENSVELPRKDTFDGYRSGDIFEDVLLRRYSLGISIMYRTFVFAEVGYYEPNVMAEDYYMNCKIAEKYEIGFIDAYLLKYRVAPLGNKRDPWKLVESHKQTVELFSNRPEYKNALQNWELRSGALLAPFKKYKLKALCYFFKNLFTTREKRNFLYLYDIAKGLCTKMWDVNVK